MIGYHKVIQLEVIKEKTVETLARKGSKVTKPKFDLSIKTEDDEEESKMEEVPKQKQPPVTT